MSRIFRGLVLVGAVACLVAPARAQVTADDYARADRFLGWNAETLVTGNQVSPEWLDGDRFWYRNRIEDGFEFVLVDPSVPSRRPAFDHDRLAAALSRAADTSYVGRKLPFQRFEFVNDGRGIRFHLADSVRWDCTIDTYVCSGPDSIPAPPRSERESPDGRWVAFERDENLWIRNRESGEETRLSDDGEEDFGYAVAPEGCCSAVTQRRNHVEPPPVLRWSADSRLIVTHRFDERGVGELHLMETKTGRPELYDYHVALPGDSVIPTYEIHVFDVDDGGHVRVDLPAMDAMNTSCCGVAADTVWKDVRWGEGSDQVFFTRAVRSYDTLQLYTADTRTGAVRKVLEERSRTYVEANARSGGMPNWRVVNGNSEVVWWSERDGWGHLYLFDATTGELKNRITEGPWMVVDLLRVDGEGRWAYFTAVGREPGRDIYYRHLYRASLDGGSVQLLSPENADHDVTVSPSGRYFLDTYSTKESEPVTVLRNPDGRVRLTVAEADFSRLMATGWHFPTHFVVKARDGVTPLHGFLYFPSDFDSTATYPVVDYIYPGPQTGPIGFRQASVRQGGNAAALAELGFIVFTIDAMGTPLRDKAFHDAYYGDMHDNGIPDHVAALRQLAARYPQMDLDRVGIYGHSGGGFSSTDALLSYPDFFKVAVSGAGNHDNRSYDFTWGEKYQGLLEKEPGGGDNFDSQANQNQVDGLQGKLMLMYGTLDDNVHPNASLLVINQLIAHNLDFDLVVLPNRNHGFANDPYAIRRTWDYFVRNLRHEKAPHYEIVRPTS